MNDSWRHFPGLYPNRPGSRPRDRAISLGRREIPGRAEKQQPMPHEHPAQESLAGESPADPVTGRPAGFSGNEGSEAPAEGSQESS